MKKVPVEKIENGMVLAKEVRGRSGNVLLSKGSVLNAFIGRRLKNWEIFFVYVQGEEESEQANAEALPSPEEVKARLEKKFSKVIHDPIMKQIFAATYQFKTQETNG